MNEEEVKIKPLDAEEMNLNQIKKLASAISELHISFLEVIEKSEKVLDKTPDPEDMYKLYWAERYIKITNSDLKIVNGKLSMI